MTQTGLYASLRALNLYLFVFGLTMKFEPQALSLLSRLMRAGIAAHAFVQWLP